MRPHRVLTLTLALVAMICGSCRSAEPVGARSAATRIVSLAPSLTEIAYDLGVGDRIVGVSDFATYPPEVAKVERLGGLMNPNLERLAALRPDLVLTHSANTKVIEQAAQLEIPTLALPTDTIADIMRCYREIGAATGSSERATARVTELRATLAEAPKLPGPPPNVLVVVGRNPGSLEGLTAAGPGTFIDELLTQMGAVNVAAQTGRPWPQMSKEALLVTPPDVIVELRPGAPIPTTELARPWSALGTLPAVQRERVLQLDGDYLLLPGPRIVQTAADLRGALLR